MNNLDQYLLQLTHFQNGVRLRFPYTLSGNAKNFYK